MVNLKTLFATFLTILAFAQPSFAALSSGTIFEIHATATTGNTNGAGFDISNANFPTDLAATSANTATPVVTSATYSFVAGDVGNYVYVKSGTHWQSGWYPIASVSTGAATLNASIGAVVISIGTTGIVTLNTTVGITSDSTATLSAGTYGVDYSQSDSANSTITDAASTASSTTLTSSTAPWTPVSVGNFFHLTAAGTGSFGVVGWYEIVSYTSAGSVVTDRTTNSGTAMVAGTGSTGGAGRLNGLENTFQAMLPSASIVWIKNGSYTFSGATVTANANSTATLQSFYIGYNVQRGDTCVGANRPVINMGSNIWTGATGIGFLNLNINGTANPVLNLGNLSYGATNVKILNSSTTSGRAALSVAAALNTTIRNNELISQNGIAINNAGGELNVVGNYIHDSATGYSSSVQGSSLIDNLFEANSTAAISFSVAAPMMNLVQNNTIYGNEAQIGTGVSISTANGSPNTIINNVLYGLSTGISVATGSASRNNDGYNDYFNNGTDVTNWTKHASDQALNPGFAGASQLTGSTANTSGSVLTDTSASFGVNDNVDFLHVMSGTGVTVGCYLITSHTSTTLTVNNALGTSSSNNVVYWVSHGHNFQIGTNLKGLGFASFTNSTGGQTTSYPDIGAVQRQEPSGSAATVGFGAP